jgi:hypothetical protein
MSTDSILALIGGVFFVSMVASFWMDERPHPISALKNVSVDGLIRFIGIVGLMIIFCVGFGIASWLISALYWSAIEFVGKAL